MTAREKPAVGTRRCYVPVDFGEKALRMIEQADAILSSYEERGYRVTLRQLYYQFVARGLFENVKANYDRLGDLVSDARLAGLLSWTAVEDRTRMLRGLQTSSGPSETVARAAAGFRRDLWAEQPIRPEVWVEKDALAGVVEGICNRLRVDFFACRGYASQSELWRAGRRFAARVRVGQRPLVLHLGDHDPSGLDMTRDNRDRLSMFAGVPVTVVRLALNMEQVEALRPPPNPAKTTDSRYAAYREQYGEESWELDALTPEYIEQLVDRSVAGFRDPALWDEALTREVEEREVLNDVAEELGGAQARKFEEDDE